jgi:uncharacterized protein (TIGR02172 family)
MKKFIAKGRTADVYQISENKILKLYIENYDEKSILNEFEISKFVFKKELPVPQPFEIVSDNNRKGIIFQYIKGNTMLKKFSEEPLKIQKNARIFAKIQKSINEISAENISQHKIFLEKNIINNKSLENNLKEKILKHLYNLNDDKKLCHGDYHPDNLIVSDKQIFVIDWLNSVSGNPASDVARTTLLIKFGSLPEGTSKISGFIINKIRNIFYNTYIKEYLNNSLITKSDINKWLLPNSVARLNENIPAEEKENILNYIKSFKI